MEFSRLWPLAFLIAVPIIIILYILKPKGTDMKISSNLLWEKVFRNNRSKTIFEKFLHEILMYLEIAAAVLLVLALMAPFLLSGKGTSGNYVIIIDDTLSMQHETDGKTRLDMAKEEAISLLHSIKGNVSVIKSSDTASLLISNSSNTDEIKKVINSIEPVDKEGSLDECYGILASMEDINTVVYTDGNGQEGAASLAGAFDITVMYMGEKSLNVSVDYVDSRENEGAIDISARFTNHGDKNVSFDAVLYDDKDSLIDMKSVTAEAGKSVSCLFNEDSVTGEYVRVSISGIEFSDENGNVSKDKDSLKNDNDGYTLIKKQGSGDALLISNGNTFVEKAFSAVTGKDLSRATSDGAAVSGNYDLIIYDAGFPVTDTTHNHLCFGAGISDNPDDEHVVKDAVINVAMSKLMEGMPDFEIGVTEAAVLEVPEGAEPLFTAGDKVVGYYGETDGIKCIVTGFDIRESDFPVATEFPIFVAGAIEYLTDTGILAQHEYTAGEAVRLSPTAEDIENIVLSTDRAGIYEVSIGDSKDHYIVKCPVSGLDGKQVAEDISGNFVTGAIKGKTALKNVILVLLLIILIAEWLIFVRKMNYKGKLYLVLRIVILLLVILSLFDIRIPRFSKKTATVFVVDLSKSNEDNKNEIAEYLDKTLSKMPSRNSYAIVTFGRDSIVDQFLTDKDMYMGLTTAPDITATDMESAISRAVSLIPSDAAGRIVLLTDGKETKGDIENLMSLADSDNISFEAVFFDSTVGKDAYIDAVDMPAVLHPGDKYYLSVKVMSNYETSAEIEIISGEKKVASEKVRLEKGSNEFVFEETVSEEGVESYEIRVHADDDTVDENNSYSAFARIEETPGILVLSGKHENSSAFMELLSSINVSAEVLPASKGPDNLADMLKFRTIILDNVYKDELPDGFLDNLKTYVKDYGNGFIVCGGEQSFMLGGYNDSVIEEVLPVNMELRGTLNIPSTAIVMIIDHSGSMSERAGEYTLLDIAVESAKRATDNLRAEDYVGVIEFDDDFDWVVNLQHPTDKEKIKDCIETIQDGGGTTIGPSIIEASKQLAGCDADIKHIILLTDGYGEGGEFNAEVDSVNKYGITMSTVAVGSSSDTQLMEKLAKKCGGRYYYADENTDIPRIFVEEVFLGGDTYIKNGDYGLSVRTTDELTQGLFSNGWYNILGYVAASQKSTANSVITTIEGDPILTNWQYGLGNTFAWNTDVDNGWTGAYAGDPDYAELWKRIISKASGAGGIGEDSVDIETKDEKTIISYDAVDYSDQTEITAAYTGPDGESKEVTLSSVSPGKYVAEVDSVDTGIYHFNVRRFEKGEISGSFTTASVVQYSNEYRYDITDEKVRGFMEVHGIIHEKEDDIWKVMAASIKGYFYLTNLLLMIALILLMLDIAGRRFGYEFSIPSVFKRRKERGEAAVQMQDTGMNTLYGQQTMGQLGMNRQQMNGQQMNGPQMNGQQTMGQRMNGQQMMGQPGVNGQPGMNRQPGMNGQQMNGPQTMGQPGVNGRPGMNAPQSGGKKNKKASPADQQLDMGTLLQKKKDRNL